MMIQLELGPDFQKVLSELGSLGDKVIEACSEGLQKGVKFAAGRVVATYLSGQSLKRRSGHLAKAVTSWMEGPLEGVVGVPENAPLVGKYKWLLGEEDMTIVPTKSKFLAIPIGEGLTGAGIARYKSPRDVPGGFFINKGGRLLFGYKLGKTGRGKFRPLFVLVKSVFVQGSGALADGVLDSLDDITKTMEETIAQNTGATD